jgi:hypothetical protein
MDASNSMNADNSRNLLLKHGNSRVDSSGDNRNITVVYSRRVPATAEMPATVETPTTVLASAS